MNYYSESILRAILKNRISFFGRKNNCKPENCRKKGQQIRFVQQNKKKNLIFRKVFWEKRFPNLVPIFFFIIFQTLFHFLLPFSKTKNEEKEEANHMIRMDLDGKKEREREKDKLIKQSLFFISFYCPYFYSIFGCHHWISSSPVSILTDQSITRNLKIFSNKS